MPWGSEVHISEEKANAVVYRLACELFDRGNRTVLVLCTGDFDRPCSQRTPVFAAGRSNVRNSPGAAAVKNWDLLFQNRDRSPVLCGKYQALNPVIHAASPYGPMEELARAADAFRDEDVEIVVTDCMGFTAPMGRMVAETQRQAGAGAEAGIPKLLKALLLQQ